MTFFDRITEIGALDRPAGAARHVVRRLLRNRRVKDALHGTWLGHPVHPALAQFALGAFGSAAVLDAIGRDRDASSRLIVVGAAAAVPTVAAGWADFSEAHEEQQRLGIVHAALNGVASVGFLSVLALRSRGADGAARAVSITAGLLSGLAAGIGGDLAFRRALGANHTEAVPHVGPEQWQALGPITDLPDGEPAHRTAGAVPVVVVRSGDDAHVLSDTCPHLGAPMSDGEVMDGALVCPWHGSTFRIDGGAVVHGPATAPLPCFETRVVDGVLEARLRAYAGVRAG